MAIHSAALWDYNTVPEAGFLKIIHVQLLATVLAEMVMSNKTLLLVVQHSFNS